MASFPSDFRTATQHYDDLESQKNTKAAEPYLT